MTDTTEATEQIPKQLREDAATLAWKYIDKAQKQKQHCYNYDITHKDTDEYKQRVRAAKKNTTMPIMRVLRRRERRNTRMTRNTERR